MNTLQLNRCLENVKTFRGTFACNLIPYKTHGYYIINTATADPSQYDDGSVTPGEHWIAVKVKKSGKGIYFDSFGGEVSNNHINAFLEESCYAGYRLSRKMVQNPFSRACGVYCMDFIIQSEDGKSFTSYMSDFTRNYELNDRLVVERTTCRLSAALQQSNLDLRTFLS